MWTCGLEDQRRNVGRKSVELEGQEIEIIGD